VVVAWVVLVLLKLPHLAVQVEEVDGLHYLVLMGLRVKVTQEEMVRVALLLEAVAVLAQ
jgi:hypothetical protein